MLTRERFDPAEPAVGTQPDLLAGAESVDPEVIEVIGDRRDAIEAAIVGARQGEAVAILGRGVGVLPILDGDDRRVRFDDRVEARRVLARPSAT